MTAAGADPCYDVPGFWDLAFQDETRPEAEFIEAAIAKYLPGREQSSLQILEVGCGGGRQVLELTGRGFSVQAFDLNPVCVEFVQRRLRRTGRSATVWQDDMQSFHVAKRCDLAHCLVNTFRHLTSEKAARQHLQAVAESLRSGGIYLLGFHLLPPDAAEEDCERWTVCHRGVRVTTTVRVLSFNRRTRLETVRFSLKVTKGNHVQRFRTDHTLRIYRADQFRSLLKSVPEFDLLDVYDFWYDIHQPLELNDELGDSVFVLRRR
jgi:SAM-dependent methyltransferase